MPDTLPLRSVPVPDPTLAGRREGDRPEAGRPASLPAAVEPLLLAADQAAPLCGVSRATWYRMASAGRCPAPVRPLRVIESGEGDETSKGTRRKSLSEEGIESGRESVRPFEEGWVTGLEPAKFRPQSGLHARKGLSRLHFGRLLTTGRQAV